MEGFAGILKFYLTLNFNFQNDDLRRKLDDFERISKAQRTLHDHNSTLENELKKLKVK